MTQTSVTKLNSVPEKFDAAKNADEIIPNEIATKDESAAAIANT